MSELNANKECILDYFGKCVIEEVYDRALYGAKRTLELTTKNPIVLELSLIHISEPTRPY